MPKGKFRKIIAAPAKECDKEKFCPPLKVTSTVPLKAGWRIALKVKLVCIL